MVNKQGRFYTRAEKLLEIPKKEKKPFNSFVFELISQGDSARFGWQYDYVLNCVKKVINENPLLLADLFFAEYGGVFSEWQRKSIKKKIKMNLTAKAV